MGDLPRTRHPWSGLGYVHVIPPEWGPFVDIHACYTRHAARYPWSSVISPYEYEGLRSKEHSPIVDDPSLMFILWSHLPGRSIRAAKIFGVYSEAIGDPALMLPDHGTVWQRFRTELVNHYDGVFGHTPRMRDHLLQAGLNAHVLPVGWDPEAMGEPRWNAPKFADYCYHGSTVGRRAWIIPRLKEKLGSELIDACGQFGRGLLGTLETARASLYIAHSSVWSFSTWRIWQCIATSAALVAEDGDTWPAVRREHYVPIPELTLDSAEEVAGRLETLPKEVDLLEVAKRAHRDLGPEFTVDRVCEKYLVDAATVES